MEEREKLRELNDQVHALMSECIEAVDKKGEEGKVIFQCLSKTSENLNKLYLKTYKND